jgi:hypothetical protein
MARQEALKEFIMNRSTHNIKKSLKKELLGFWEGEVRYILEDVTTGKKEISPWMKNLVVDSGKSAILNNLGGDLIDTSKRGYITYGAVATGTVTISASSTTLDTEIERQLVSKASVTGTELTIRVFYTTGQANGTITNFGWFGEDATGVSDSGTLFNKIAVTIEKTNGKTLTIEQKFTL